MSSIATTNTTHNQTTHHTPHRTEAADLERSHRRQRAAADRTA